jgi:activating signal cointegrator complex subunit 3
MYIRYTKDFFVLATQLSALRPRKLRHLSIYIYMNCELRLLQPYMTDADILNTFCHAQEFAQVKVRDEEVNELMKLARKCCVLELKHPVETEKGKTAVLFQAYISRARVDAFTLGESEP